ncbi:reverse transcriptase [Plakobranchus ocellatus]|uniref:Reverse transcriptase n=1 Tax=Plakobranchus ocellatus TaxID=259542 RepID=A0AAV4A2M6_9GAST|nr:reverse transcriptase [Plakobranchus ocellatus]
MPKRSQEAIQNTTKCMKNIKISKEWMTVEGVYIPKEQDSRGINQFRPISLLNVEGKIFFSVMASCLTKYLTENGYRNTSVQKGGIPGVSGCLEHATMIWEAIQRAKSEKLNLDVVWLDLANAYGSVPHEMIQLALRMYHVPEVIQVMLDDYFRGFHMRFSTNNYTTNWINLEVGIAMGCTIFPILFLMAMEVILKVAEGSAGPANLGGGCSMPPLKAFMDDTTIICSKEDETRRMLTCLDDLMSWCRMEFKPKKSRNLSIRRGKVDEAMTFTVVEQQIPTVSQEPVKSLGRWYDSSMKDTRQGAETLELASESLLAINKCGLQRVNSRYGALDQPQPNGGQKQGKEKRDKIIDEIRNKEDSKRVQKAVQQPQQGQWTNWDDIWHMAPLRISFLIRSAYDLLPSNANLVRYGKKDDPTCPLFQSRQTTEHVLSSCKVALSQRRYTWRHNRVLQELASVISTAKGEIHPSSTSSTVFTTEGGVKKWHGGSIPINSHRKGLLDRCDDWVVSADLPEWERHPDVIRKTALRPDIGSILLQHNKLSWWNKLSPMKAEWKRPMPSRKENTWT